MGGPILSWALRHPTSSLKAVRESVTGSSVPARIGIPGFQDIEATGNHRSWHTVPGDRGVVMAIGATTDCCLNSNWQPVVTETM